MPFPILFAQVTLIRISLTILNEDVVIDEFAIGCRTGAGRVATILRRFLQWIQGWSTLIAIESMHVNLLIYTFDLLDIYR